MTTVVEIGAAAERIRDELTGHPEREYDIHQVQQLTGLLDKPSVRKAIKRAWPLIEATGMFMPVAIGTRAYAARVNAEPVYDAYLRLDNQERGTRRRKQTHGTYVAQHVDDLPRVKQLIFARSQAVEVQVTAIYAAHEAELAELFATQKAYTRAQRRAARAQHDLDAIDAALVDMA